MVIVSKTEEHLQNLKALSADPAGLFPQLGVSLSTIRVGRALMFELSQLEELMVRQARADGASWEAIASAARVSRQGIRQRYPGVY